MKAIVKAALVGSAALLALPSASHAFSLRSALGFHQPSQQQAVVPPAAVGDGQPNVVLAQATGDATVRMQQLEESVRQLTGKVEDLNYQLLQMEEQMRQMQKDNEFRFQQLEGGHGGGGGGGSAAAPSPDRSENVAPSTPGNDHARAALPGVAPAASAPSGNPGLGTPPRSLGSLSIDANGNPVGGTVAPTAADRTQTAALPQSSSPEDIYRGAYNAILQGRYAQAEQGFRDYIDVFPDGPQAADASFWLGESEYSQGKFNEAAKTFLDSHQKYPKAEKAPETLLKLGMALAALNNQDTACATYHEVLKRYPKASASVRQKVAAEESRAGC